MKILVVGNKSSQDEFKSKFDSKHSVRFKTSQEVSINEISGVELIIDFETDTDSARASLYSTQPETPLMINSVFTTVAQVVHWSGLRNPVIGFNGLPGYFNRSKLEIATSCSKKVIESIFSRLGTKYAVVKDRVGMVTPRIICMIINEAFHTVHEGIATESDIDLAMKLGTNYPAGPFEMVQSIGINHVYQLLEALHRETTDERYQVCPLLRSRYQQQP